MADTSPSRTWGQELHVAEYQRRGLAATVSDLRRRVSDLERIVLNMSERPAAPLREPQECRRATIT